MTNVLLFGHQCQQIVASSIFPGGQISRYHKRSVENRVGIYGRWKTTSGIT